MKWSTEILVSARSIARFLCTLVGLATAVALGGCERAGDGAGAGAGSGPGQTSGEASNPLSSSPVLAAQQAQSPAAPATLGPAVTLRLASLSPAMTDAVLALGLGAHLVGRTPWCDPAVAEVPVIGSLNDFDAERLVQVKPTHLLVQPPRSGIDAGLVTLADELGVTLVIRHIDGLDDVRAMMASLPEALLGREVASRGGAPRGRELDDEFDGELRERAAASLAAIDAAIESASDGTAGAAGRVLLLFSVEPVMAFGPGSYVGDLLVAIGGVNALDGRPYPELTLEDVQRLRPETILLVRAAPAGDGTDAADGSVGSGSAALQRVLGRLDVPAVVNRRLGTLSHTAAMTPGPRVGTLALALRDALHNARPTELHGELRDAPAPTQKGSSASRPSMNAPVPPAPRAPGASGS